jgi:hypothetical protein
VSKKDRVVKREKKESVREGAITDLRKYHLRSLQMHSEGVQMAPCGRTAYDARQKVLPCGLVIHESVYLAVTLWECWNTVMGNRRESGAKKCFI